MFLTLLVAAQPAFAADRPEDVVEYRHVQMEAAAKHMKSTAKIVKGVIDRKQDIAGHAASLHALSMAVGDLFPEGTDPKSVKKTEALPSVWERRSEFDAAVKAFETASQELVDAAAKGDDQAIKMAFGKVGKSCGGCHDDFKKDDEH